MEPPEALDLLQYAMEQEAEEKLWQRWVFGAQFAMGFDEFKQSLRPPQFKSEAALLADTEKILNGGHHGNI